MKTIATVALVASLVVGAHTAAAEVKVGDHFVELDTKTAKGKVFRLKDMAGKWVLYTFGASWCQPCHKELPAWDQVAAKLGTKVLFVAVNINNKVDDGREFIDSLKLKHMFPVFMPDEQAAAMKAYDPERMPSTFVIDPSGIVRAIQYGYTKGDEAKLVAKLVELTK